VVARSTRRLTPAAWSEIADPDERLRTALAEPYEWAEPMLNKTLRDAPVVPAMAEPMELFAAALAFPIWRTLVRERGLTPTRRLS